MNFLDLPEELLIEIYKLMYIQGMHYEMKQLKDCCSYTRRLFPFSFYFKDHFKYFHYVEGDRLYNNEGKIGILVPHFFSLATFPKGPYFYSTLSWIFDPTLIILKLFMDNCIDDTEEIEKFCNYLEIQSAYSVQIYKSENYSKYLTFLTDRINESEVKFISPDTNFLFEEDTSEVKLHIKILGEDIGFLSS